ncbi:MAG: hypothetical protein GXO39_01655 [Thermotogae bacterium]|nr:hypothetical protein [Thermotogota bacterium]
MDIDKVIEAFEHECTLSGGTPNIRKLSRRIYATCDVGPYTVELKYNTRSDEYTLSASIVSDTDEDVYTLFAALRTFFEEESP